MNKSEEIRALMVEAGLRGPCRDPETVKRAIEVMTVHSPRTGRYMPISVAMMLAEEHGYAMDALSEAVSRTDHDDHSTYTDYEYSFRTAWRYIYDAADAGDVYAMLFILFYSSVGRRNTEGLGLGLFSPFERKYYEDDADTLFSYLSALENYEGDESFVYFGAARANEEGRGYDAPDIGTATDLYFRASELGERMADVHLACLTIDGECDEMELARAIDILEELKDEYPEDRFINYYLGLCYYHGIGREIDRAQAYRHFRDTNDGTTDKDIEDIVYRKKRYMKGVCHFRGEGTEQSYDLAYREFVAAFGEGDNGDAWYAMAIGRFLSGRRYTPECIYLMLVRAAKFGSLPAVRKLIGLTNCGLFPFVDKATFESFVRVAEEMEQAGYDPVSDLGEEADAFLPKID